MTGRIGFDNERYLSEQTAAILERVARFDNKLYLEFGGKLMFDQHAARVLPGYDPNVKMRLLSGLADTIDVILCIYAGDIERRRIRGDFGITYDADALKLIDDLASRGVPVSAVVITRFDGQESALKFQRRLERRGVRVYTHRFTKGYPTDVDTIVSEEGYGANTYLETTKPIVVVTGPGPNSGKLATCLSQLYHEHRRGVHAGYAKFETFPIWNLPLAHPVNIAYEAATADIGDFNAIDSFHLEATNERSVNYNRDLEVFPVLRRIMERISGGASAYRSPTEMGVNRAGFGIVDDASVREAAVQEVIRRFFRYSCEYAMGVEERKTVQRVELLMKISARHRKAIAAAQAGAHGCPGKGMREPCERPQPATDHRHGQELTPHARRLEPRAQRGQATGGHPRFHPPPRPAHYGRAQPFQEGRPGQPGREPGPGRDADLARHQCGHESRGRSGGESIGRAAGLRGAHHPHSHAR
jgi:uncharacterized protein (UPF0371 family)